jgi:hypothetical protein
MDGLKSMGPRLYVCSVATTLPYLRSAAAIISYAPAAYVRIDWQQFAATPADLRGVYDHVLRAMLRHGLSRLMSIHNHRPPMPVEVQTWLTTVWIPRAMAEVSYGRCAIVEANTPLSRLAARAVGAELNVPLTYRYFSNEADAAAWLVE